MELSDATEKIPGDTRNLSWTFRLVAQCLNHYATPASPPPQQCVHFVKPVVTGINLDVFVRKFKPCGFAVISRCYCVSVCNYCVLNICNNTRAKYSILFYSNVLLWLVLQAVVFKPAVSWGCSTCYSPTSSLASY